MEVLFDPDEATTLITPSTFSHAPIERSVKDPGGTRRNYRQDSFCIRPVQKEPLRWVIDAASEPGGGDYYLTTHGRLLRRNGTDAWSVPDPKWTSIAFVNGHWWLLRSDGRIFKTSSIENSNSFYSAGIFLPTARKLVSGPGPTPCL